MSITTVSKKYIEREGKELKIHLYYNIGGANYASYRNEARGYYLSVTPVERKFHENGIVSETIGAFTGTKVLLKEVARKSKKSESESELIAKEKEEMLIEHVLQDNKNKN